MATDWCPGWRRRTGLLSAPPRGKPKVQMRPTPHEIHLNLSDRTWAHWLIGDAGARWLGVPLLNLLEAPLQGLSLKVLENDHFRATSTPFEGVVGGAVTQVPFLLQPKAAWTDTEEEITATLRVESPSLEFSYEVELTMAKTIPDEPYRMTFRSPIDGSVSTTACASSSPLTRAPTTGWCSAFTARRLRVLAGSEPIRQRLRLHHRAHEPPPFGFDWEEWGRLNALASLDNAVKRFRTDPRRCT